MQRYVAWSWNHPILIDHMKNEPPKETPKGHFFDLINRPAQPLSGAHSLANVRTSGSPVSGGYSGKQLQSRNVGGASGRHGGKSR